MFPASINSSSLFTALYADIIPLPAPFVSALDADTALLSSIALGSHAKNNSSASS